MNPTALSSFADRLNDALPQTQCTRCGFPDCRSYAQAIAAGEAGINQCPPGGAEGIARLARLTGRHPQPLSAEHGSEGPRRLAIIDEAWCIGCTLCIKACPVECIVGASKQMHTVIEAQCTGCELCIPVCPVDCISLESVSGTRSGWAAWSDEQAAEARARHEARRERIAREAVDGEQRRDSLQPALAEGAADGKRAVIEALLARAKARRGSDGREGGSA